MELAAWSRGMTPGMIARGIGRAASWAAETNGYVLSARRNRGNKNFTGF